MNYDRMRVLAGLPVQEATIVTEGIGAIPAGDNSEYNELLIRTKKLDGRGTPEGAENAKRLGRMAFGLGIGIGGNPFFTASGEFYGWQDAWRAAQQEAQPRMESVEEPKEEKEEKEEKTVKVKVPSDVSKAITSRVAELKAAIEEFDNKGYNDGSVKQNAVDALEQIATDLKQEDGKQKAGIFLGTLMSPILDLIPPKVIKFIVSK